jgi:hypothetical protein
MLNLNKTHGIGIGIGLVVLVIVILSLSGSKSIILPRQSTIRDCGYNDKTRGWYDMQNQGVRNDYCRWVGDPPNWWFSCHKAGASTHITPNTVVYNENDPHDPYVPGTYGC